MPTILAHAPPHNSDPSRSNSLVDLAARIKAEHEAAAGALKRGVEHAMTAGDLLIEAKAQVPHGQWLPWLAEHCAMSERTAQLYMRVAREQTQLEASNPQGLADLTLEGVQRLLAKPIKPDELKPGSWEWAEAQLNGPFSEWDFEAGRAWLQSKLMHLAKVPALAAISINWGDEYDLPVVQICDGNDLMEALIVIAPIAKGKYALPLDSALQYPQGALIDLQIRARRIFVVFFDEIARRKTLMPDQCERERNEISKSVTARIEAKKAEWREICSIPDEDTRWTRVDEFLNARHGARP